MVERHAGVLLHACTAPEGMVGSSVAALRSMPRGLGGRALPRPGPVPEPPVLDRRPLRARSIVAAKGEARFVVEMDLPMIPLQSRRSGACTHQTA